MNRRVKQAMITERQRRKDGTFMERSGTFGTRPDGTSYPIYPMTPYTPPIYERYDDQPDTMVRNRIGFAMPDEWNGNRYGMNANMKHGKEAVYHTNPQMPNYTHGTEDSLTKETASRWVKGMKNADGSSGPHWTLEQARQIMEQQKAQCDELEFYVALNMMYSDYCKVAKKFNVDITEFYACLAKAFLEDKDAQPDKLMKYYEYITKH